MSTYGQAVLGVDTHNHTHVAVILDGLGRHPGMLQFRPMTPAPNSSWRGSRAHGVPWIKTSRHQPRTGRSGVPTLR